MKVFIRKLLREGLNEADFSKHSLDRIKNRFNTFEDDDISPKIKERVKYVLDLIGDHKFPKNKSFAVMLTKFSPNPESIYYTNKGYHGNISKTGYYSIPNKDKLFKQSIGDEFWAIIRDNEVTTIFLRGSDQTTDPKNNTLDLNVDFSIKDIDSYIKKREEEKNRKSDTDDSIINIDGTKWVVDSLNNLMFKKNKPKNKYDIDKYINKLKPEDQYKVIEKI